MQRPRPLDGIRVLDLTRVLSGPHCTRMLCDLGAEVIKLEPPDGDLTRFANPRRNGLASYFVQQNVGKANLSVDLSTAEGHQIVIDLLAHCDVLVENYRPGVMDRLGLGAADIRSRFPRLVYASISGYGQDGPWVNRRAYAPVVGAEAGLTHAQGQARGGSFANDQHSHADVYTSLECAAAILAALVQRGRTGEGDRIDVSMAQTMLYVNEHGHDHLWDEPVADDIIRSFQPGAYPVITAANGETVVISGHPAERGTFELYMRGIDRPELIDDPRFADVGSRLAHLDALHDVLRRWAATMPSADAIETQLGRQRIATGRLRTYRDVCDTDWATAREATVQVADRGGGTIRIPNAPWRFDGSEVRTEGEPRYRGEDNVTVLRDLLGYEPARIDALIAAGVLSSRVPSSGGS